MFCTQCGTKILNQDSFCGKCGNKIKSSIDSENIAPSLHEEQIDGHRNHKIGKKLNLNLKTKQLPTKSKPANKLFGRILGWGITTIVTIFALVIYGVWKQYDRENLCGGFLTGFLRGFIVFTMIYASWSATQKLRNK